MRVEDMHPLSKMPWVHRRGPGEMLPRHLIGARILRFGAAPAKAGLEGGGLVIDYIPGGGRRGLLRVVLEFNERGMWFLGPVELTPPPASATIRQGSHLNET